MEQPLWKPKTPQHTQMAQFIDYVNETYAINCTDYNQLHTWSINNPRQFWPCLCGFFNIAFDTPWREVLNDYQHLMEAQWFEGARFNFAQKLLSRRDDHLAIISINEHNERLVLTYQQLYQEVAQCAAGLRAAGVQVGDRVAAMLPNSHFSVIAMLATTSIGAIWSSCSPDFGAQSARDRLGQIAAKVLFISDGHYYNGNAHSAYDKLCELHQTLTTVNQMIICPNIRSKISLNGLKKARYWNDFIIPSTECQFEIVPFAHPIYILFSSGTTGQPKCIIHSAGGTLLQHIKELALHTNLNQRDNLFFYTTCGWMMWNWMVSALTLGTTLTLYDGSPTYPDKLKLFEIIDKEQVSVFGTSAKFISAIEKSNTAPKDLYSLKSLKCILSTGSPLLSNNYDYVYQQIKHDIQLSSISGGTDILSCFALGNPMLPVYKSELQCIGLGMAVNVYNEKAEAVTQQRGELVCTKPFPSMPLGFWNDPHNEKYYHAYFNRFPNVWTHGDFAELTIHHGLIIYGRSDTTLNPGGVRIGTAEIYRQIETIKEIEESIVIGQQWNHDERIVLFVKLKNGVTLDQDLKDTIRFTINTHLTPRHVPSKILQVEDIPRTLNGKIVELAVKQIVHHLEVTNYSSLVNPEALQYFKDRDELS